MCAAIVVSARLGAATEIPSNRVGRRRKRSLRDESARERSKDLEALGLMGGPTQTTHLQFQ